ncbi:MAG: hypothetical protein HY755_02720 [Nitrospirae bacterium]|nr:hypothetical protein [Nitrospirota bacterium]
MKKLWDSIGMQLRDILAFPRQMNGGNVPDALKTNNYVLGFHYMMCIHLYHFAVKGKTDDPEEGGFVLINSVAIALEMDAHDIVQKVDRFMSNPDKDFTRGIEDAKIAFEKLQEGDTNAMFEFNKNIRGTY